MPDFKLRLSTAKFPAGTDINVSLNCPFSGELLDISIIFPDGQTCSKSSILDNLRHGYYANPWTRTPLAPGVLVANHLIDQITKAALNNNNLLNLNLLVNPRTQKPYQDPVVACDGFTYDRSEMVGQRVYPNLLLKELLSHPLIKAELYGSITRVLLPTLFTAASWLSTANTPDFSATQSHLPTQVNFELGISPTFCLIIGATLLGSLLLLIHKGLQYVEHKSSAHNHYLHR